MKTKIIKYSKYLFTDANFIGLCIQYAYHAAMRVVGWKKWRIYSFIVENISISAILFIIEN